MICSVYGLKVYMDRSPVFYPLFLNVQCDDEKDLLMEINMRVPGYLDFVGYFVIPREGEGIVYNRHEIRNRQPRDWMLEAAKELLDEGMLESSTASSAICSVVAAIIAKHAPSGS